MRVQMRGNTVIGCKNILKDEVAGPKWKAHTVVSLVLRTGLYNGRNTVKGKHQII